MEDVLVYTVKSDASDLHMWWENEHMCYDLEVTCVFFSEVQSTVWCKCNSLQIHQHWKHLQHRWLHMAVYAESASLSAVKT